MDFWSHDILLISELPRIILREIAEAIPRKIVEIILGKISGTTAR